MATVTAVEAGPPPRAEKKKLLIVGAAVLALVLGGVAATVLWLKHRAQVEAEADDADGDSPAAQPVQRDPKAVPVFVALESFTVNLADREADRYAQVGISLELNEAATAERIKVFMPAIRNNILMVLSHKRSAELLDRAGKEKLAAEVQRETERALGFEPPAPGKKGPNPSTRPIRAVHFSNFIIQ